MVLEFDYDVLARELDEDPEMVLDDSGDDVKKWSDRKLDEKIQTFISHTEDTSLKLNTSKLFSFLEKMQAEKALRERARASLKERKSQPLTSNQQIPEKRVMASERSTPRNVKERKIELDFPEETKDTPRPAFSGEIKLYRYPRGKKKQFLPDVIVCPDDQPSAPESNTENPCQASAMEECGNVCSPDTVVLYSSDEENENNFKRLDVTAPSVTNTRRTSLRIAERRKVDLNFRIAYPSKDDPHAVEVYYGDYQRLRPAEFLNDTVIDFYIEYLQRECIDPDRKEQFHFFNTFFFKKLTEAFDSEGKQAESFSKLRKWTKGIDILSKSYLFLPVNDRLHWSLAIVCFSLSDGLLTPYIFHLDSLENGHPSRELFKYIQSYLEMETGQTDMSIEVRWEDVVKKRVEVPRQENEYDCGLFLLYYIKSFVESAPLPCKLTETKSLFGKRWFKPSDASMLRRTIRQILERLFEAAPFQ